MNNDELQQFADELVKQIEVNEAIWQKGWATGLSDIMPVNHQGTPYRGDNIIHLMMASQKKGFSDNRWFTFNNAKEHGGHVRRGEKGASIKFYTNTQTRNKKDEQGNDILDKDGRPIKETIRLERPIVKSVTVFNAEQIDGLPPREVKTPLTEWERHEKAENIIKGIEAQGVTIEHTIGDRAYYSPTDDKIVMPERGQFATPDLYYATVLHEIGHSTGYKDRLNRNLSGAFGSESYAKEELRAEIASMIVGEQLQIGYDPSQHHAYLKSWAKVIKEDPKEIFRAVTDANKISDYVISLGREIEKNQADREKQNFKHTGKELENIRDFLNGEAIISVPSGQIKRDENGKVIANAKEYMRNWLDKNRPDGIFHHPQLGEINFFVRGVKDSISHYGSDIHINALPAVPYVLENSVIIDKSVDKDGKNIENYILASPVNIDEERNYVVVRLKKELDKDKNPKFYIVSAETENEAQKNAVLTLETRSAENQHIAGDKNRLLGILHQTLVEIKLWEQKKLEQSNTQPVQYQSQQSRQPNKQSERLYLYTRPSDNEAMQSLKAQGIVKFDLPNNLWYANKENADAVRQWTTRPNVPTAEQALSEHLRSLGIKVTQGHPIFDDQPHRLSNDGSSQTNVMYHAYANPNGVPYARITNFSRDGVSEWIYPVQHLIDLRNIEAVDRAMGKTQSPSFTQEPNSKNTPQSPKQTPQAKDQEKLALENQMAERAKMLMSFAPIAPSDQHYLNKKQVTANGIAHIVPSSDNLPKELEPYIAIGNTQKQYFYLLANNPDNKLVLQRGNLVIPQTNAQGEIRAFETIAYNGRKYALKHAQKSGLSTKLGNIKDGEPIIIAEGYATGATLHEHTNRAVVVAFGKGGLMDIAKELRENYPNSKIYIGADNDHISEQNYGLQNATAVAKAVNNVHILTPQFNANDKGKDWNDVYVDKGVDELKRQLKEQLAVINSQQANQPQAQHQQPKQVMSADPLDADVIRQNYPTMSDDNIQAVQLWRAEIFHRYADKPNHQELALGRLINKLPDYAKGETLPPPKSYVAEQQTQNTVDNPAQTTAVQPSNQINGGGR